jgi:lipid II:glycine glycyltransferase (peptidoglycan interpeptide bridge formation enzyme)
MTERNFVDSQTRTEVHRVDSNSAQQWDEFVQQAESVHLEQLSSWGRVRMVEGWLPEILIVRRKGDILGGALILVKRFKSVLKVAYVSRGPLVRRCGTIIREESEAAEVVSAIKLDARRTKLSVLIVDPPYRCGYVSGMLGGPDFTRHLPQLPPSGLMKGTLLIDLRPPEADLLLNMRRSTRQVLRKADEAGLRVRQGGADDVSLLWKLLMDLCRRRGVTSNVSSEEVLKAMWVHFGPIGRVRIDVIEKAAEPLAALMTVCVGGWAVPWRIGWSGAESRYSPEKALYWSVMRSVRQKGSSVFDFNWIDPQEALAIRSGTSMRSTVGDGVTNYKIGFGGEILPLAPAMDYFPNPVVRAVMLRYGGLLGRNPAVLGFLNTLIRRK